MRSLGAELVCFDFFVALRWQRFYFCINIFNYMWLGACTNCKHNNVCAVRLFDDVAQYFFYIRSPIFNTQLNRTKLIIKSTSVCWIECEKNDFSSCLKFINALVYTQIRTWRYKSNGNSRF